MTIYAIFVTLFLGILITPCVQGYRQMRIDERAESMKNHPSNYEMPFNVTDISTD